MKDIIKKVITDYTLNKSIQNDDIIEFIKESFFIFRDKYPDQNELGMIVQLFNFGIFTISDTVKNVIEKLKIDITILYDSKKNPIRVDFL